MLPNIHAERLSKTYTCGEQEVAVLIGINGEIEAGTLVALIGLSGCGKSAPLQRIARAEQEIYV